MEMLVAGADKTGYLRELPGAVRYRDELGTRSRLSAQFVDLTNALDIPPGVSIKLTDDAANVPFTGTVERSTDEIITEQDHPVDAKTISVECVSHDQLLDRRLFAALYEDALAGDIVRDIVDLFADDGLDADFVEDGPVIPGRHIFNYDSAAQSMDRVSKLSGYIFWVDGDLHMHFQPRTTTPALEELTDGNYFIRTLKRTRTREGYRNVQYVRAGHGLTSSRTESFTGDSTRKTFNLAYPVGTVPTATVNAVSKTVGIKGVETGKDFYWNKESTEFSQDDGATALTAAQTLAVTYRGMFPVLVQAKLDDEIVARAAVEGGSGVYEAKEDHPEIDDQDAALSTATARLAQKGYIAEVLDITTRQSGFKAGMLLPVSLTREGLSGEYLIVSVDGNCDARTNFVYTLRVVNGDGVGGWTDYFRQQVMNAQSDVASDNEFLLLLRSFSEPLFCDDVLTATPAGSGSARIDEAIVDFSEIG